MAQETHISTINVGTEVLENDGFGPFGPSKKAGRRKMRELVSWPLQPLSTFSSSF